MALTLGAGGCAAMKSLAPPPAPAEQRYAAAVLRMRDAFERGDRLGVLAEVDQDFSPRISALEQTLIDDFLGYNTIHLDLMPGAPSHGSGEIGLRYDWTRSWTLQAANQLERKQGECVFVLKEDSGKLERIDGQSPFDP